MKNKKAKWFLENFPIIVAGVALVLCIAVTTVNALGRYLFSRTFAWADEIVAIGFCYTVFFGSAAAFKYGMHYGLEFMSNLLPKQGKKVLELLIAIVSLILVACLAYLAWVLTLNVGTKIFTASRISYCWFDLGLAGGLSIMVIYAVQIVYRKILALLGKEKDHE